MEDKSKLKRTNPNCEGDGSRPRPTQRSRMVAIDRFSKCPDHVSHHILSLLTISDLARLSCVSKSCRKRCLSIPSLNISGLNSCDSNTTCAKRLALLNSLERFLLFRGDNKLQRFHFRWCTHDQSNQPCECANHDEFFHVVSLVHKAVRCNAEEIDLDIGGLLGEEASRRFPSSFFLCGSLRSLSLKVTRWVLKVPPSSGSFSSNLKCLRLEGVVIEDHEAFFKWISCCCKCIQDLNLQQVHGIKNITLESSSLKTFHIFIDSDVLHTLNVSGEKLECLSIFCKIISSSNIFAPNLERIWLAWRLPYHLNFGEFKCLKSAGIDILSRVIDFDTACKVFRSFRLVKALTLSQDFMDALFKEGSMPFVFNRLRSLRINIMRMSDKTVPAMVSLIRGLPKLYHLFITSDPRLPQTKYNIINFQTYGFDMGYWKLQNPAFINELEKLTLDLSYWPSIGVELARYILEFAPKLKTAVIICSSAQILDEVKRKLLESKTISNATVVLI